MLSFEKLSSSNPDSSNTGNELILGGLHRHSGSVIPRLPPLLSWVDGGRRKATGFRTVHDILKPLSIWLTHHRLTWNWALGETRRNGPWTGKKMQKRSVKITRKLQVIFFKVMVGIAVMWLWVIRLFPDTPDQRFGGALGRALIV